MGKKQEPDISVTPGSGNVFADLGFAEPEEELTKAQLASHIRQGIQRRRLTQVAAAALMGIEQPKVSAQRLARELLNRPSRLCGNGRDQRRGRGQYVTRRSSCISRDSGKTDCPSLSPSQWPSTC